MSEIREHHPRRVLVATIAGIGTIVLGCMTKQIEVAGAGFVVAGIGAEKLVIDFLNDLDMKTEARAEIDQFITDINDNFNQA